MMLFPILHALLITTGVYFCFVSPSIYCMTSLLGVIYLFPVAVFRLHNFFKPLKKGFSRLDQGYSPWFGAHQIQVLFNVVPFFESILRLIPGAYSAWLRLWGSKIGKRVYWTPVVEITDRSLLIIGDRVIFGHRVGLFCHVVSRKKNRLSLYIDPIKVGDDAFIGAGCYLGPGVSIEREVTLPTLTIVTPRKTVHHNLNKTKCLEEYYSEL